MAHKWSHLRLPENLVLREKTARPQRAEASSSPSHTLILESYVVCFSDVSKPVAACFGCIQRERKRVKRKKDQLIAKTSAGQAGETQVEDPFEAEASGSTGLVADQQKILLFNCGELVRFPLFSQSLFFSHSTFFFFSPLSLSI